MATVRFIVRRDSAEEPSIAATPRDDLDLLPAGALLWTGSVVRVASALARNETFGVEATLALGCVVLFPVWLIGVLRRRRPGGTGSDRPGDSNHTGTKAAPVGRFGERQGDGESRGALRFSERKARDPGGTLHAPSKLTPAIGQRIGRGFRRLT